MSMHEYPIVGYGFDVNDVAWDYEKLLEKLYECDIVEGDLTVLNEFNAKTAEQNNKPIGELFKEFDSDDEVFELITNGCTWLSYENASENGNYIIMYALLPWQRTMEMPVEREECDMRMWNIISKYTKPDFTFEDFELVVTDICDTYYG